MRDNLPTMLRAAAKEWREKNKVIATGATRYDAALEEAADAIEKLGGFVQEAERDRDEYRERLDKANDAIEELSRDLDSMNEANIALYGALPKEERNGV